MQSEVLKEIASYYSASRSLPPIFQLDDFRYPACLDLESVIISIVKKRKSDFQRLLPVRKRINHGRDYEEDYYNIAPSELLHNTIVRVLEEELPGYFHYVEPAPRSYSRSLHRELDVPDLLCQHPREQLVVLSEDGRPVDLHRFSTALIEVKSGQAGGSKKQLADYWRRNIGTHRPTARLRFSYQRRELKIYC